MTWVDVTIAQVVQETPLDRSFLLARADAEPAAFVFAPGQYVRLRDPQAREERDWYFSLSAAPHDDGTLRVTVRARGDAVQGIYDAPVGTRWRVSAPAGEFHVAGPRGERVVLAAAGSGITPFRAFVEHRIRQGNQDPVWLLHCARHVEELVFRGEFEAWAGEHEAFTYVPTVTGGEDADWKGRRGRVDASLLTTALAEPATARLYACGPAAFVEAVLALGTDLGVPPERLLREQW